MEQREKLGIHVLRMERYMKEKPKQRYRLQRIGETETTKNRERKGVDSSCEGQEIDGVGYRMEQEGKDREALRQKRWRLESWVDPRKNGGYNCSQSTQTKKKAASQAGMQVYQQLGEEIGLKGYQHGPLDIGTASKVNNRMRNVNLKIRCK